MASDKPTSPANKSSSEEKAENVEIWEPHPKQQPVSSYWPTSAASDRRRAENAKLRHWMNLGDQALRSTEDAELPTQADTQQPNDDAATPLTDKPADETGN